MTREIKFRAWLKNKNVMCIPSHMKHWDTGIFQISVPFDESGIQDFRDFELMQFTGLLDKNGKEIYEGDIMEGHADGLVKIEYDAPNYIAKFDDENSIGLDELMLWFKSSQAWVIGNIYENPELLHPSEDKELKV